MKDIMEIETWAEIGTRQAIERAEAVMSLCDSGLTQAQAARALQMCPRALNNYLQRNKLQWTTPKQGPRKSHKETEQ